MTASDVVRLRPQITSASSLERERLRQKLVGQDPATVPQFALGGDLVVILVLDGPSPTWRTVDDRALAALDLDLDAALDLAWSQLERAGVDSIRSDGSTAVASGSNYAAVGVFLPGRTEIPGFEGDPILIPVAPDLAYLGDSEDPSAIAETLEAALTATDQPNLVSVVPLIGREDRWQRLQLEPEHPAYEFWRASLAVDHALSSEHTSGLAEVLYPDALSELVEPAPAPDGRLRSATRWRQGSVSLVSEADLVIFEPLDASNGPLVAEWGAVLDTVSMLMAPVGTNPERWRLRAFPTEEQLVEMGAVTYGT